jgi:methionyl-tRNA synthetase
VNKYYVTTAIPYINSKPHIGFALEIVQADVVARWRRLRGDEVFFLTGTDEHGSKVDKIAKEEGTTPQAVAERNSALFAELKSVLNLSSDDFIRTSDPVRHWPGAQKLWRQLDQAGDIYKDTYAGLYCVGCENFITEKDLVDGKCPTHALEPEAIQEENYFFRLSKYGPEIAKRIKSGELKVIPEGRSREILNLIESGLTDISFSRSKDKLPWGVPVPGDDTQTMYVWCDALSNYITGIGYGRDDASFAKWWPADLHVIGKDILRFHAAIWPGMLISAGLATPKSIFVHGFVSSGGRKMSKSLGNVIDPVEAASRYGADALRYYLLREIPATDDGDFSWQRFEELYNHELADNLGNLVSRVVQMVHSYFDGKVPDSGKVKTSQTPLDITAHMDELNFSKAILAINARVAELNGRVDHHKPWELAKSDDSSQKLLVQLIYSLLEDIRLVALHLYPFLPATANSIYEQLGLDKISKGAIDWTTESGWGVLNPGASIGKPDVLFPKRPAR